MEYKVILANRSSESEETVTAFPLWIISITNCSLFISALLLDEESKLPLLDALHTWNLLWLANVTIFLVLSTHPHQTKHPFRESRSLTQARESRIITLIKSLSLRLNYGTSSPMQQPRRSMSVSTLSPIPSSYGVSLYPPGESSASFLQSSPPVSISQSLPGAHSGYCNCSL
ncbi:MAG: hypothetical protein NXY57DRAFT_712870 [Lentinula lateritia]|nr:MAG: hypothetical protein NXY57DRAFT_712870 [Lentinula lateritia]